MEKGTPQVEGPKADGKKTEKKIIPKTEAKEAISGRKIKAQPVRLYCKGTFLGYRRSLARQQEHQALIKIEGVNTKESSRFYLGKRVAYIYKGKKVKNGSRFRVIWGKVNRPHGGNGVCRASFRKNLPARAMAASLRVMLYPSNI